MNEVDEAGLFSEISTTRRPAVGNTVFPLASRKLKPVLFTAADCEKSLSPPWSGVVVGMTWNLELVAGYM
jgi:hypothetical protein